MEPSIVTYVPVMGPLSICAADDQPLVDREGWTVIARDGSGRVEDYCAPCFEQTLLLLPRKAG